MSWHTVKLKDIGDIVGGGTPSTKDPSNFGQDYGWVTPKDLSTHAGRYISFGNRGLSQKGYSSSSAKLMPAGTVLISSRAPIGLTAIASRPLTTNQGCRSFVPGPNVDSLFMYYLLASMKGELEQHANGSTFREISGSSMENIEVDIASLDEQRAIAKMLGSFDDKIESNRRIQILIEQLVRAYVSEILNAAVPENGKLQDYCSLVKDTVKIADLREKENYVGLEHMPRGSLVLESWGNSDGLSSNKTRFQKGDILFGKLRPYFKKVVVAPIHGVCSTDIIVLRAKRISDIGLVAAIAASDSLIDYVSSASTGTRMPRTSWNDIAKWQVPILNDEQRYKLSSKTIPLINKMSQLTFENHKLVLLRDTLLPELLAGRLGVSRLPKGILL